MTGSLPAGKQLPPVRELSGRLKVNPMTISKAYSFLEASGLAERRRGVGLFAAEVQADRAAEAKAEILSSQLKKAAVTAVQLEIPKERAIELLSEYYSQFNGKKVRSQP